MSKIETVMKSEIVRLTKKELRAVCGPLARDVRRLKRTVSGLSRTVASLNRIGQEWAAKMNAEKVKLQAPEKEVKASRFSPRLTRTLRKKLGLSQGQLALLLGVTSPAVGFWEQGKSRPSGEKRAAIVALRKLGKREVRQILEQKKAEMPKKERKAAKKRGKKTTRKTRRKTR